ncbi:unnamed protein product [Phytomonas sp. Hart1]|nr:unnamed protein product [Phytomonas sp. Hart1]|eukprot:CCW72028.1 unnamed protein product [Phytomonas sp. isolate Hart1]
MRTLFHEKNIPSDDFNQDDHIATTRKVVVAVEGAFFLMNMIVFLAVFYRLRNQTKKYTDKVNSTEPTESIQSMNEIPC